MGFFTVASKKRHPSLARTPAKQNDKPQYLCGGVIEVLAVAGGTLYCAVLSEQARDRLRLKAP
jgi:hypothetical protein